MKKILSVVLALCLALGCAPGLAEALTEKAASAPKAGDVVYGFEAKETRPYDLVGAEVTLFEHQKTGAQLLYVANNDTNRVFQISFRTRPIDETGLPHVFEHSTLNGCDKYPSGSLFMNLMYQTYNTHMNAYTTDAMTYYPVASLSEAQLLKYADFYTDSCLHPSIMKDESIYRTEAWRYHMADMEDELTYEGTVYTEMLGASTITSVASSNAYKDIYPGSVMGYEYGGNPDYIPDMTWESLKDYHDKFYHPSNALVILYGQFDDYTAFLRLLDEAFAGYEKTDFHFVDSNYTPITGPVVNKVPFPVAADASTENQAQIYYYILLPGMKDNIEARRQIDIMGDLMSAASSPLIQNLKKALPTGTFGAGRELAGPEDSYVFVASNVNENDAELFKATVDSTLRSLAETGFSQEMVDTVMASLSLSKKLAPESGEPVNNVTQSLAYYYSCSGNPFEAIEATDALDSMDDWNSDGTFQRVITDWLLDKDLYSLTTTYPVAGLKEEKDAALKEKMAGIKAAMSDEEKQAIIDATNAQIQPDDASALVAQLQAVDVETLPEEYRQYEYTDETGEDGVRRIDVTAAVDDIGTTEIYLDAQTLPQEDIHYMRLYTHLLGELDTDAHTAEELAVLMNRYLYNSVFGVSVNGKKNDYHPYLVFEWTAASEDLKAGYDLVEEIAFHTQFTDAAKLLEKVQARKTAKRTELNRNPYQVSLYRAFAVDQEMWRYYVYLNQLDYYAFLENVEAQLQENPEEVMTKLQSVQRFFENRRGAVTLFAGDANSIQVNRPLADQFLAKLNDEEREPVTYDLPVPAKREAVIMDTNIQFNCVIASEEAMGMDAYDAGLQVVNTLVTDDYLTPELRDKRGVYTPWNGTMEDAGMYLITYRDPKIKETFDVYATVPGYIANLDVTQDVLNGYILNNYSTLAKGEGELAGAVAAAENLVAGKPLDRTLTLMKQLKAVTPETVKAAAAYYQAAWDNGVHSTAGSAAMINENADLYDVILNPFGAVDTSAQEFADAAEGSEYYEAVRFVFENGLMLPAGDTEFGTEAPATASDLYAALYVLVGGPLNPEEAFAFMAQNGLVPEGLEADTQMNNAEGAGLFGTLTTALGAPFTPEVAEDAVEAPLTRGGLAQMIQSFVSLLQ